MMEKKILYALRSAGDEYVSGEYIAGNFGISRTTVWNYIEHFRRQGYDIDAHPRLGYRLRGVPDRILPDEIQYRLNTKIIGRKVYAYECTDSTNDIAWQAAVRGEPEGTVIFAESQRKGRGRFMRRWFSPKGRGLWFSVILRPVLTPSSVPLITAGAAAAAAGAVRHYAREDAWIKWPNDICIGDKKAGGILAELNSGPEAVRFIILGIGINTNNGRFPGWISDTAVSVKVRSRIELAKDILRKLEYYYGELAAGRRGIIIDAWREMSFLIGRRVRAGEVEGTVQGIDDCGALLVREDNGFISRVTNGDIICC